MRQIRRNVFETNSSSVHSITICMKSDFDKWISGEVYLNKNGGWRSYSVYKRKQFVTKEEAIDILIKSEYSPVRDLTALEDDELEDYFRDKGIYTYDNYVNDYFESFESYEQSFTTPNRDEIVAFGYYGHD